MNYYYYYPTIERIITKDIWTKKDNNMTFDINLDLNKLNTTIEANISINTSKT